MRLPLSSVHAVSCVPSPHFHDPSHSFEQADELTVYEFAPDLLVDRENLWIGIVGPCLVHDGHVGRHRFDFSEFDKVLVVLVDLEKSFTLFGRVGSTRSDSRVGEVLYEVQDI